MTEDMLPPKPTAPLPSDCCGSGCSPCVHDIYEADLKIWKNKCREICSQNSEIEKEEKTLTCTNYSPFKLSSIQKASSNSFIYTFELPPNSLLGLKIGQHLIVRGLVNNYYVSRPYTPISDLDEKESFKLLIKIYEKGKMSSVVSNWKEGDLIEMRGPYGSFTYVKNSYKKIVMLAAGTGIAPMFQIIKYILNDDDEMTKIHLMYSSKNFDSILLRDELYGLQSFWNFTMCHFLSEENNSKGKKYSEMVNLRRISKRDVELELLKSNSDSICVLICGTKSFEKDMLNAALNIDGISEGNIFRF